MEENQRVSPVNHSYQGRNLYDGMLRSETSGRITTGSYIGSNYENTAAAALDINTYTGIYDIVIAQ